jgi:hypothetical protein
MSRPRRRPSRQHSPLRLEPLEARWLPTTFTPTTFADGGPGSGSLRDAVLMANADAGTATDTIQLAAGTYTLTIPNTAGHENAGLTGDLNITSTAHTLIIQGAGDFGPITVIDASQLMDRAFQVVNPGTTVVFRDLVIQGGLAQDDGTAGALPGSTDSLGGGILDNGGTLTLTNVVLKNNRALGANGANGANGSSLHLNGQPGTAAHNALGGGLYATGGSLNIMTSTLSNNQAIGGNGGAGGNGRSNFATGGSGAAGANGGSAQGGGVFAVGASLTLTSSTLTMNTAQGGAGGAGGTGGNTDGGHPGNGGVGGAGGAAQGAGFSASQSISVPGPVSITGSGTTVSSNVVLGGAGGAGGLSGVVILIHFFVPVPAAGGGGGTALGGGFYAALASVDLAGCTVATNALIGGALGSGAASMGIVAGMAGGGGAYFDHAAGTLTASVVSGNNAQGGGGSDAGPAAPGQGGGLFDFNNGLVLTNASVLGNAAQGGAGATGSPGGGAFVFQPAETGGTGGDGQGGGIYSADGTLGLTSSTIGLNVARGGAGGAGGGGTVQGQNGTGGAGGLGGNGQGAGLYVAGSAYLNGSLGTLINCTISTNGAQGGPGGKGGNGSTGGVGGMGGTATGGGFDAPALGTLGLQECTVAANAAAASVGGAGGTGSGGANGVANVGQPGTGGGGANTATVQLVALNTIVAGNGADVAPDFFGLFFVANHDLVGNASFSNLTPANPDAAGNQVGSAAQPINPLLGPLANNGGPTETMALLPGSPAINAGLAPGALPTDQRGVKRDAFPDVGAYEFQPAGVIATGADAGGGPQVNVYDADTGALKMAFLAYAPGFLGGVRVAVGDVNGDGVPDIITAPGPGGGPDVRVFDGKTGILIREFMAYTPGFLGGVYVAAGDVNGDGFADVVTGADAGGGPEVKVFSGKDGSVLRDFFAYAPTFTGGVRVAAGDVDGDGHADVVTGAGPGGGPEVKVFSGKDGSVLQDFFAYAPTFAGGVYVAAGDVNGDGKADVITGAGADGGPHVNVYSGADGTLLESFFAYDPGFTGGVRVGYVGEFGTGGGPGIVTGPGAGAGPIVQVFGGSPPAALDAFFAYDPRFLGGVFVGGG